MRMLANKPACSECATPANKAIIDLPHRCRTCHSQERSLVRVLTKLSKEPRVVLQLTDRPVDKHVAEYFVKLGAPHASPDEIARILQRFKQVIVHPTGEQSFAEAALDDASAMACLRDFSRTVAPGASRIDPWKPEEADALAEAVGVTYTQNVPKQAQILGRKSGSRALFGRLSAQGVRLPEGSGHLIGTQAVEDYIHGACQTSSTRRFIIKLDAGQAGEGNAIVDLTAFVGKPVSRTAVHEAVKNAQPLGHAPLSSQAYFARLSNPAEGGVVEHFLPGPLREASGKMRLTDHGDRVIGVHMQRMGSGPTNCQSFVGGVTPADANCSPAVVMQLRAIGAAVRAMLLEAGVNEPHLEFGVDFLVSGTGPEGVFASEINLRHTGMSPTDWLIQYVVGGEFDNRTGDLFLSGTHERRYVQTRDWLRHPAFQTLPAATIIALIKDNGLHFNPTTKTGVMVQAFEQAANNRVPVVCVGRTLEESERLLQDILRVLAGWVSQEVGTTVLPASLLA